MHLPAHPSARRSSDSSRSFAPSPSTPPSAAPRLDQAVVDVGMVLILSDMRPEDSQELEAARSFLSAYPC